MNKSYKVTGKGNSFWGKSKGEFEVNKFSVIYSAPRSGEDQTKGSHFLSVNVFGTNIDWFQYTDTQIEKEIKPIIAEYLKENGWELITCSWSEQGLQPDKGWNFDVGANKI
jgi:hypothetical protein